MAELKKKSCCCGATESNPCACMKKGIMKCSAKEPMCQCYKDLKKEGKHPDDLKKSFSSAWIVVKRDGKDYGQMPIKESTAMTHGTDLPSLKTIGRSQRKTRKSGGKSPRNISRVDGAHASSSSRKDKTDHKKSAAEASVDAKLRNAGAKGQR